MTYFRSAPRVETPANLQPVVQESNIVGQPVSGDLSTLLRAARSDAAKAGAARAKAAGVRLGRPQTQTPGRSTRYVRAKADFLGGL